MAVLSAVLLCLPFLIPNLWILSWVSLVPFFLAIEGKTTKQIFYLSYFTGILFWAGTIYWLIHVSLIGLILLILYLSLFFALFGILTSLVLRKKYFLNFIFIPCLWVSLEYLRAHLFSGFGWALLGYSQYLNLPVIQVADITGTYGVSFLIVMANAAIFYLPKKNKSKSPLVIFIILLIPTLVYGFNQLERPLSGAETKISVVQGNIPQEEKWDEKFKRDILEKYKSLTRQASRDKPDLIIWPETSVPGYLLEEQWLYDEVTSLARETKTNLLVGAPVYDRDSGKSFNSAILFSPEGKMVLMHHKLHLVPFGEFVPFEGFLRFIRDHILIGDFIPGKKYTIFFPEKAASPFGVLICFEDTFPELVRRFINSGADFMINITNDAWFKKTAAPYQHLQASVFRAVENRINVVRSANTGYSGFINPKGEIINRVHLGKEEIGISGFSTQVLTVSKIPTFYRRFGDIFALMCIFLSLLLIFRPKKA